jgi:23S rRNA (uracil1939-C5)-methyltransferase
MSATSSSRCRHFGSCGGCLTQDQAYEAQLAAKSAALGELFSPFWPSPIEPLPSPDVWYYRNKVELSFHLNYDKNPATGKLEPSNPALGFKRRGRWYETLDIEECFLLSPELSSLLGAVREWARAHDVPVYDQKTRRGLLRHLVVREGKNTGERLVMLLAAPGDLDRKSFARAVSSSYPATTILVGTNDSISDVAQAQSLETLEGPGFIRESLTVGPVKRTFRVSPFSFFQTNTRATEKLYGLARDWVADEKPKTLLDLYGGSGTIGLSVNDLAGKVVSVEAVASATADGHVNAEAAGAANIEFVSAAVEAWLPGRDLEADAAIVDPPRSGLHPKALKALVERPLPRLLYVSCNPKLLARELPELFKAYRLEWIKAVDMFPHTEHVEAVASLRASTNA